MLSEAVSVKQHWSSLRAAEKLAILRFQDRELIDKIYETQQSLYEADLECYIVHGLRGQEKARLKAGSQFFDVEGVLDGSGNLCPRAFVAQREFVEMEDMFEFLEERLERPFLEGVPHLEQQDWISLLEPQPSSWLDFVRVSLRLVELALRKHHQDVSVIDATPPTSPSVVRTGEVVSQSAKRKARKRRCMLEKMAEQAANEMLAESVLPSEGTEHLQILASISSELEQPTGSTREAQAQASQFTFKVPTDDDSPIKLDQPSDSFSRELVHSASESPQQNAPAAHTTFPQCSAAPFSNKYESSTPEFLYASPVGSDSQLSSEIFDVTPVLDASTSLRHSAREARIGAVVMPALIAAQASRACARESWIQAEIHMQEERRAQDRGRSRPSWLLADGSSGENWIDGGRAVIKNTFLEVEKLWPDSSILRSRSWPASWCGA